MFRKRIVRVRLNIFLSFLYDFYKEKENLLLREHERIVKIAPHKYVRSI